MTAFTLIFFLLPVRKIKGMKREFMITFGYYWINPFGRTQYRDMIIAACMLTFKTVITDGAWLICLYTSGAIVNSVPPTCSTWVPIVGYFMGFIVYYLCSMQRFRRYLNDPKIKNQLYYSLNMWLRCTGIIALTYVSIKEQTPSCPMREPWPPLYTYGVAVNSFYVCFMICWDLWITYGMLRCWKAPKWGLREKLYLPSWVYYPMIVYCMLARWVFAIDIFVFDRCSYGLMQDPLIYSSIVYSIDVVRRFIWVYLRTECEMVYNLESFRSVDEIPEVNIDADDPTLSQQK